MGFKNPDDVLERKEPIHIVVVGDSFAEGMGVATEDIFSSILSRQGHLTYNMGVQGYAPKQMEGSFRLYGLTLKPKYVIIACCSTSYSREASFLDEQAVLKEKKLTGGIASVDGMENIEIRVKTRHITTAIYLLTKGFFRSAKQNINNITNVFVSLNDRFSDNYLLSRYSYEISKVDAEKYDLRDVEQSPEWKSTVVSFLNIKKIANQIGAKVIIIIHPHRGSMCYKKATGKELPQTTILAAETTLLRDFCKKEHMVFLNPSGRIQHYVNELNYQKKELYPYL